MTLPNRPGFISGGSHPKCCDPRDSSSAKSRRACAALCPGKVASTIAQITISGGGNGQTRLLPGDFSQSSPTAFARVPERPSALGDRRSWWSPRLAHRSSLTVRRDCHACLPPLFSSPPSTPPRTGLAYSDSVHPPLVTILLSVPPSLPPSLSNLSEPLGEETKRADVAKTDSDSVVLSSHSRRHQSTPHPTSDLSRAWAKAWDASSLRERADSRRLPPSSLVRPVEDSGDLDTIEGVPFPVPVPTPPIARVGQSPRRVISARTRRFAQAAAELACATRRRLWRP
ncbi:hypothetical protein EDB86DRAFT_3207121 [Lactarius hatsudake]|nr:hypothetical protein EDB86DRAFT_3207121 [Lactarius hatsudake]